MKTSKAVLFLGTVLATATPATAHAQAATAGPTAAARPSASDDTSTIIVTARRIEERLQDVPISITVFNQQQIANKNIASATDLATYTPSLSANNNFGQDSTTFAIRGFAQDIGTAPSVGVYFGDVVAPRGGTNGQPVGDTANPGDFFDMQNVQVLKGPQGTLFGRNTTGGAVIFVPQKPTEKLEGYIEGGYGNYNERRIQGVLNIPLSDSFRVRFAGDRMLQDGYLNNISGIGPRHFDNTDYTALRLSIVGDLTPDLENYIIASYTRSNNHGALDKLVAASASQGAFGGFAAAQLAQQAGSFYNVENPLPDAYLRTTQWQVIDTTTWKATDDVTIKNIASYAQLTQRGNSPIFGINWQVPVNGTVYNTNFEESVSPPGLDTANESTFTDEFRFQGNSSDNRFSYQTGAYIEIVRPLSEVGSQSPGFSSCADGNGNTFNCTDTFRPFIANQVATGIAAGLGIPVGFVYPGVLAGIPPIGNINYTVGETSFHDVGLYAQGTYKLTDQFKLTGGFRYTWDHEGITSNQIIYALQPAPTYGVASVGCENFVVATPPSCLSHYFIKSSAPTWLVDLDYTPTRDLLAYAKYSRGYRAATIAPNIPEGGTAADPDTTLNYVKPEKVDAFEVGLKTSFAGSLHGTFNVAGFYNNFTNQQLQVGFIAQPGTTFPETAAPVNAGKSKIYGAEIEASISPFHGLDLTLGYTYLRTRIDAVNALPSSAAYITQASFNVGDPEVLSPRNKLVAGANYTLPTPDEWGRLSVGGSVTYRSSELTTYIDRSNPDPTIAAQGTLPPLTLVDANVTWANIGGAPVDLAFFVTNLTDRKYYNFAAGLGSTSLGFEVASVGAPRMVGGTLKFRFGS